MFALVGGCSDFPRLDVPASRAGGPYPALAAYSELADFAPGPGAPSGEIDTLQARALALRSRAELLTRPVLSAAERQLLLRAMRS